MSTDKPTTGVNPPTSSLCPAPQTVTPDLSYLPANQQPLVSSSIGGLSLNLAPNGLNMLNNSIDLQPTLNVLAAPSSSFSGTLHTPPPSLTALNSMNSVPQNTVHPVAQNSLNQPNASHNSFNAFNPLQQPQGLLNTSPQVQNTMNLMNNTSQPVNNTSHVLNTLNQLNTSPQALGNLSGGLNTLSSLSNAQSSQQSFLSSTQLPTVVSLPQTFCFPVQSSQSSLQASDAGAGTLGMTPNPGTLGMTLGFPLMAGTTLASTSGLSLGTGSVLNSSGLMPTLSVGASNPILQSLSLGPNQAVSVKCYFCAFEYKILVLFT
jgi:hypothetical protein